MDLPVCKNPSSIETIAAAYEHLATVPQEIPQVSGLKGQCSNTIFNGRFRDNIHSRLLDSL
jgi:hypothetical protein